MSDIDFLISNGVDINKSLELFGDIETYNATIGDFLISYKNKIDKLTMYKNNSDMANYAIYVHSLKSDARYFGFTQLAEIAYEHEMKSKAGDAFYIREHFNELLEEGNKAIAIIKAYLEKNSETTTNNITTSSEGKVYSKKTILVVDDSNIIRNFVKRIFNDKYVVETAKDGQETIDIIEANKENDNIAAILLDLNMPRVDGFAVLDYMKEKDLFNKIPVSIISGDSSKDTIDRAFTYQIVDMLGKPFNENDIKNVVEKTLYYKELV